MAAERSKAELDAEIRFWRGRRLSDGISSVLNNLIKWGGLVLCVYFGITRPIEALAGRLTLADIAVKVFAELKGREPSVWLWVLPLLFGIGGIAYGLIQRKLRRDTVERLHVRIKELETSVDPHRTSSTLTTRGDTRQEDRT